MHCIRRLSIRLLLAAGIATVVLTSGGCIGVSAHLLYFLKGQRVKAEFSGLKDKRVAVVCNSSTSSYGPGAEALLLAHSVSAILQREVKGIQLIDQEKVADWIDNNAWDQIDYRKVGKGVDAELLVAIELSSFSLHEGQSLYKGRATISATVYDMTNGGKIVYRKAATDINFPENGARHVTDINESNFRRAFIQILAQEIGKRFYDYEKIDDVGMDATFMRG
jgi:hypothetical protein